MDGSRSLALSSWNGNQKGCCSDVIGCVTFGVKHLLGRQKHGLNDTSYKPKVERAPLGTAEGKGDLGRKTARVRRISGLQSYRIVVECLNKGYGFTVRGGCPTRVGHVRQGSSAQLAGLREGDYITHINACDVTFLGKQDVAKVVRQARTDITLDIRRHPVQSPWQQEVVDSLENLQLDLGMSAAEKAGSQSRSSSWQPREEERVEGIEKDGSSRLSSDVTFDLLSMPVEEQERLSAVENMRVLEDEFISLMQSGIQRFSRPLRHCLVSSNQHATLFQNVEKLVTISEYYLSELTQTNVESDSSGIGSGDDDVISHEIGAIYRAKVKMCSEAYHVYSDGLTAAIQLLGSLMLQPLVISFLQEDADKVDASELSIEDFLCKPIQHLEQVYRGFERILLYTSPDNADYDNLQYVARVLGSVCTHDSSVYEKSTNSLTSTSGSRSHRSSRRQHRQKPNTFSASRNISKTAENILSDRPVLFSGDLMSVCAATCRPLLVLLLNDSLVMMSVDSEGHMTLAGEPLVLRDIVRMQFECDHPSDFMLSTKLAQDDGVIATRNYRLRAGCYDDKVAWRNVLEYQVAAYVSPRKIWSVSV